MIIYAILPTFFQIEFPEKLESHKGGADVRNMLQGNSYAIYLTRQDAKDNKYHWSFQNSCGM